jgi:hypothetical protein
MARTLRTLAGIGLVAASIAVVASPAAADTTIGQTFTPMAATPCNVGLAILQSEDDGAPSYAVPTGGTITSWSTESGPIGGTGQARLKVYRLQSGSVWTVVGESNVETLNQNTLNTFATSIPVSAGDRLALLATSGTFNCGMSAPVANVVLPGDGTDHPPGDTETFGLAATGFHLDVSAVLSQPSPPQPPSPSNAFTAHVRGKTLLVDVSAPGSVGVADAAAPLSAVTSKKKRKLLLKPSSASGNPPTISVPLHLSKLAKQKLRQKGKVTLKARVTFTPTGGTAATQTAKLKIKGKSKGKK